MGKRNIIATSNLYDEESHRNRNIRYYDFSLEELTELYELSRTEPIQAIVTAFQFGFVLGTRAHDRKRVPPLLHHKKTPT